MTSSISASKNYLMGNIARFRTLKEFIARDMDNDNTYTPYTLDEFVAANHRAIASSSILEIIERHSSEGLNAVRTAVEKEHIKMYGDPNARVDTLRVYATVLQILKHS